MFTIEKEVAVNQVTADGIAVGTTTLGKVRTSS